MKKLFKHLLLSLVVMLSVSFSFMLVGCGEEEEEIPYELTVSAIIVDDSGEKIEDLDLTSELGEGSISKEDFEALSCEHIGGNGFQLSAPYKLRYEFVGWYNDEGRFLSIQHDFWWEMYDREGEIKACYKPLKYTVKYSFGENGNKFYNFDGTEITVTNTNPTEFDCTKQDEELICPVVNHYKFAEWYYRGSGNTYMELADGCLPIDERDTPWFTNIGDSKELTVFGVYDRDTVDLTFASKDGQNLDKITSFSSYSNGIDPTQNSYVYIPYTASGGSVGYTDQQNVNFSDAPSNPVKVASNWNRIVIYIEVEEGYRVDGWEISDGTHTVTISGGGCNSCTISHNNEGFKDLSGNLTITLTITDLSNPV